MKSRLFSAVFARAGCARIIASLAFGVAAVSASARDYEAGDIRIQEPFATPTRPGSLVGAAYFGALENRGTQADRLLRASSPAAGRIELHSGEIGADGVMRMRELDNLPLPPKTATELRPGQGNHLMLMDLGKPLTAGESFPMTLEFERGGKVEVDVQVKVPDAGGGHSGHKH